MKATDLMEATQTAERVVENYYSGGNVYQGSQYVLVCGNVGTIIQQKHIAEIEDTKGFIFRVKYKNKIPTAELVKDLSKKENP